MAKTVMLCVFNCLDNECLLFSSHEGVVSLNLRSSFSSTKYTDSVVILLGKCFREMEHLMPTEFVAADGGNFQVRWFQGVTSLKLEGGKMGLKIVYFALKRSS